ncbi:MAG TPA: TonB-dependent receptor [Steroidobacteraceae bacterium]|nr:TonB-dependent receptor [Steroidobacteraceae bacterium]
MALTSALAICAPQARAADSSDSSQLNEIVVTATLRPTPEQTLPGSVSVLDAQALHDAGQQNFEDVMALVPNLNWAGDTSLPRYFQIRGIGELQQYQGAPNPSVGFLIDDIDFSGLGMAGTLFDVDRIEVLHGPQGTIYGANALAGLIYVRSADPSDTFGGRVELDAGDYGERSYGAVLTGPVPSLDSAFRLAVQQYTSDGFYHNAYLDRDTDNRNELTVRGKWRYQPNDDLRVDLTALRIQIDNGYDAWSIYNGSRTTQSDQPGVDRQYSTGFAARATYTGWAPVTLTAITTYASSDITYSFDGDWGNPAFWAPYTYQYFEIQQRDRTTRSAEVRLAHSPEHGLSWLFGFYGFNLREGLSDLATGIYLDPFDATQDSDSLTFLQSRYSATNSAIYGQLDGDLGSRARWSVGMRGERHTSRYDGSTVNLGAPTTSNSFDPENNLWGGHVSLDYTVAKGQQLYALISRGYKAGGFNLSEGLPANQLLFSPEYDVNYEIGDKAQLRDGSLRIETSLFYMARHSEQLLTGEQLVPDNPNTFVFYTGNAVSGYNYGLESQLAWRVTQKLEVGGSLGLLQTLYRGFVQDGVPFPDRALPHAAPWQAALNATWRDPRGPFARLDVTGMGSFFYDMPPNWTRSTPYGLVNAKVGWRQGPYELYLWGRNLFDKDYTVRGFYFGNQPPNFNNALYTQLGEPRNFGVHFTYDF